MAWPVKTAGQPTLCGRDPPVVKSCFTFWKTVPFLAERRSPFDPMTSSTGLKFSGSGRK